MAILRGSAGAQSPHGAQDTARRRSGAIAIFRYPVAPRRAAVLGRRGAKGGCGKEGSPNEIKRQVCQQGALSLTNQRINRDRRAVVPAVFLRFNPLTRPGHGGVIRRIPAFLAAPRAMALGDPALDVA